MSNKKQKLTLSVDKELVEKAKKLGVNISEITEKVLEHISGTTEKEVVTREEIDEAYKRLFEAMLPAMKKFRANVKVGYVYEEIKNKEDKVTGIYPFEVYLLEDGELWIPEVEARPKFHDTTFDPSKKILSNYIDSLVRASEKNKEKLKELEVFRRVIEALTETTIPEYREEQTKTS
jgi:ribosomal protein L13